MLDWGLRILGGSHHLHATQKQQENTNLRKVRNILTV